MWRIDSPKNILSLSVSLSPEGTLLYEAQREGISVLATSAMGLSTLACDLTEGLSFQQETRGETAETYSLPAGKKKEYENASNDARLVFTKYAYTLVLELRVFDQGFAYRYLISGAGEQITVNRENTQFVLGEGFQHQWMQDWIKTYEGPYNSRDFDDIYINQHYGMPSLAQDPERDLWLMINEAQVMSLAGNYCSCHLKRQPGKAYSIEFAPEEKGRPLALTLPLTCPWRVVTVCESLNTLVNSTLVYNVNPPATEDYSWVKPARALWAWWEYENGAQLFSQSRDYVDFAAAMGFEAVTLDCPWDACWVPEICDYSHKRNVQIWIWTGMQRIDTLEKAQRLIPLWASWGVDGLKVDFFENDSCHTMWQYNMIRELMTKHKLMINFHGSTKPMGEGRTWPNFITAEGIMGLEHYKWSDMPNSLHNCTVPFTRNVAGPMDYTPLAFSNANRNTTIGHQLALPVVFESGVTNYSMSLHYMEAWNGTDFLRRSHAKYDSVRVLSGNPGNHAAILRQKGGDYLIGLITCPKQSLDISLSFLPEGEHYCEIYEDEEKGDRIQVRKCTVTREDTLLLNLMASGGAGIYITREEKPLPKGLHGGYLSDRYQEFQCSEMELRGGSEPLNWGKETGGFLLQGQAAFTAEMPENKGYSLRFFYSAEKPCQLEITDGRASWNLELPISGSMKTQRTAECRIEPSAPGTARICIRRVCGGVPAVTKIRLIDNDPPPRLTLPVTQAQLTGRGEIILTDGIPTAVGLGSGSDLIFKHVTLPESCRYILSIEYAGGESRDISIVAGDQRVDTYLHCTAGWGFPVWNKFEGKEILINLHAGENTIVLTNPNGPMSHIRGICIWKS